MYRVRPPQHEALLCTFFLVFIVNCLYRGKVYKVRPPAGEALLCTLFSPFLRRKAKIVQSKASCWRGLLCTILLLFFREDDYGKPKLYKVRPRAGEALLCTFPSSSTWKKKNIFFLHFFPKIHQKILNF